MEIVIHPMAINPLSEKWKFYAEQGFFQFCGIQVTDYRIPLIFGI